MKSTALLNSWWQDAKKISPSRFQELGVMRRASLWDTTMNAETRTLLQVKLETL